MYMYVIQQTNADPVKLAIIGHKGILYVRWEIANKVPGAKLALIIIVIVIFLGINALWIIL